jgi:DNA-3-methyladenine glycosylase I
MCQNLRCPWGCSNDSIMQQYHDHEWGKLNLNEQYLYEMLVLELFQSGLNWAVVLHKRKNFYRAFKNFVLEEVAQLTETDIAMLMQDKSIIRNRLKILAAIQNAKAILTIETQNGSFAHYLQNFIKTPIIHHPQTASEVPTTNALAIKLSKQMKKDGFTFVGPITIYSYLQGIGLVNDHLENCPFKYHG